MITKADYDELVRLLDEAIADIELHARKNEAELIATSQGDDNKQNKTTVSIRFCPMCGRNLASPYTEGATK